MTMTQKAAIRAALMQRMQSGEWAEPIAWPNVSFVAPNNSAWLRFTQFNGESSMVTLAETDRQPIVLQIDIFAPKTSNDILTVQLADKLENLFSKKAPIDAGGMKLNVQSFRAQPDMSEPVWYRVMCTIVLSAYVVRV